MPARDPPQALDEKDFDPSAGGQRRPRTGPTPQGPPDPRQAMPPRRSTGSSSSRKSSRPSASRGRPTGGRCSPTRPTSIAWARPCSTPMPPGCRSAAPTSGGGPKSNRCPACRRAVGANTDNPEPVNERRLAEQMVPQYPWTWSAGVLAGLLGLSLCILSTRVKSLDRLR